MKARTLQTGIHRITFASLKTMGFVVPENVRVFGFPPEPLSQDNNVLSADDLVQYPLWQTKDKQSNESWIIYIPGNVTWKFEKATGSYIPVVNDFAGGITTLYLTEDISAAITVQQVPALTEGSTDIVTEFDDYLLYKQENINLIESGSRWFSDLILPESQLDHTFTFPDHVDNEPVKVSVSAAARCDASSTLGFLINNSPVTTLNFQPYSNFTEADYASLNEAAISKINNSDNLNISLKYNGSANGKCWLDYIRVQSRRKLQMQPLQIKFSDSRSSGSGHINEFRVGNSSAGYRIWDITSPLNPFEIPATLNSGTLIFKAACDSVRQFVAFDPLAVFPGIEKVDIVGNQNLHGLSTPDMLIVTTPDFISEAERLAAFHRQNDRLDIAVIPASQIYNEFSGGNVDPTSIRNFVRYLYYRNFDGNTSKLKYLLLFGKGTYDNIHPVNNQNPCFIPTWQSENSVSPVQSYVTDDYFGLLGKDEGAQKGVVDIGIGRIPCMNTQQAKATVDKIIHYNSTDALGEWRNMITFVADDEDNNIHASDSEELANFVNHNFPAFYTEKIYLDAFQKLTTPVLSYPNVNKAINTRVKEGALLINYVGHANEEEWAAEKVLTISDIDGWSNINKLPVFVTATCEFSRWDMATKESAGEHVLFNPVGGGVALFSTTRMVYASSNFEMNKSFFKYVFQKDKAGNQLRMGDIIRLAKSELGGTINASKFSLIGDPALQISVPKYNVATLEINNQQAIQFNDTVKPLSLVSVWGEIQNVNGEKISGFNGLLYPNVFDKPVNVNTLGNNGQTPFTYSVRNSNLFRGNVTVKQGEFSYSFEVPKEINYHVGDGLIRNYSKDGTTDANGSYASLKLGGTPVLSVNDVNGPVIKLFLDNEKFKNGDKVSKSPLLLADLQDESGINTSGSAIGHDIVAILDNQTDKMILLNSYFETATDSYKKGKVIFQLPGMNDGVHTLRFRVWDLANNSSETEIKFLVSAQLVIKSVITFANPFKEYIDFVAEYNRYSEKMTVQIEIYSLQGVLVDQVRVESASSGFTTLPVRWNPGLNNHRLAAGMYYYRYHLTASDGSSDTKTGQIAYTR